MVEGARKGGGPAKSYRVEALSKGLTLLSVFSETRQSLRLTDLCALTDIPVPTAFRLLATLQEAGYVERLGDGSYRPGAQVLTLGYAALRSLDLVQCAEGPLHALAAATGETVNLAILSGDQIVLVVRRRRADLVTANLAVGSTLPAVHSSLGKVLLAALEEAEVRTLVRPASLSAAGGPNAVSAMDDLLAQLAAARRDGVALQDQEVARGLRSLAAPIKGADSTVVAAINIAVNVADYTNSEILSQLKDPLLTTASEISRRLGMH